MVIIAVLTGLFVLFFFIRHHTGPAHLAMIAGLSVYETFGVQFTEWLHSVAGQIPLELTQPIIYIALVAAFPLLLYLRSHRGGLHGILRIVEAALFACLMAALLSSTIAKFVTFDSVSQQISNFITSIEGPLVLIGVVSAYLDILIYRKK